MAARLFFTLLHTLRRTYMYIIYRYKLFEIYGIMLKQSGCLMRKFQVTTGLRPFVNEKVRMS